MEAQDVARLLGADLIVSEILNVFDVEAYALAQSFFHRSLYKVTDLADRVISGRDVENSGKPVVRLDRTDIGCGCVLDTKQRPPDGGVVDRDRLFPQRILKHRVD